jgi:acetolactate synthase-1/2/3 large subunit
VLMTGDSAMLFHIAELETAAREQLPLVCVVAVDHQWGLEAGMSRRLLGPDARETGLHWGPSLRFDHIAQAMGCQGAHITHADDLAPALAKAFDAKGPSVLHVAIDARANADSMPGLGEFASWFNP